MMFLLLAILVMDQVYSCKSEYNRDKSWPDPQVTSLQVFGSGITVDSQNNIIILHRGSKHLNNHNSMENLYEIIQEDVVMILDSVTGKILATWGRNIFGKPHGIEITKEGDIFITDVSLHQVFKFCKNNTSFGWVTEPELLLGERFVSGNDQFHFCSPADVAVLESTGDFFVADGYCNSRVLKFDKRGLYLGEFEAGSAAPAIFPVPFNVTHAVVVAQSINTSQPLIFVADRNNGRVQCFTSNGTFLYEIGYENFSNRREMVLSLVFTRDITKTEPLTEKSYGVLYAVNGHLPLGQAKVFKISVRQHGFRVISSFPVSTDVDILKREELRIETPHNIALTKDANTLYIIEARGVLTVKRFMKSAATFLSSGYSLVGLHSTFFTSIFVTVFKTFFY